MPAIVYNTRYDPAYRNAEAQSPAPYETSQFAELTDDAKARLAAEAAAKKAAPAVSKSNMEKYFFMAVIAIGLGVVIYKSMKK